MLTVRKIATWSQWDVLEHGAFLSQAFPCYCSLTSLCLSLSLNRGATVEHAVELITGNCRMLWGGIPLRDSSGRHFLSREKTVEFFLTTFRSFVDPLILMRLLLHRSHNHSCMFTDTHTDRHTHTHMLTLTGKLICFSPTRDVFLSVGGVCITTTSLDKAENDKI